MVLLSMKRNYLPDNHEHLSNEQKIIDNRLNELFSHSSNQIRRVSVDSKGYWLSADKHVKIDSIKGISSDLVSFSSALNYYFLNPYEALYCLETNQLIIHFNGFPLSLAEAYQLLLSDTVHFRNYRVFQQLNRSGFICLKPKNVDPITINSECEDTTKKISSESQLPCYISQVDIKPILEIKSIQLPFNDVLSTLQRYGPQGYRLSDTIALPDDLDISFEVYKRETFAKNKPRRGKQGNPDYYLIICDKNIQKPPSCNQLLKYRSQREDLSGKLLYALLDDDYSICFTQFKPMNPFDLVLF